LLNLNEDCPTISNPLLKSSGDKNLLLNDILNPFIIIYIAIVDYKAKSTRIKRLSG
jgi:hypothetical protein